MKIHIIGGPGSGKSTLAARISTRLGVPSYDLDLIGQRNGTNAAGHIDDAFAIAASPGWVAEGIYLVSTDPLLDAADMIVLLDVPWRVAAWRICKRHVVTTLRGTNQYGWGIPWSLLGYARAYYHDEHIEQADMMVDCLRDRVALPQPVARDDAIAFLETYHPVSIPPNKAFVRRYLAPYQSKVVWCARTPSRRRGATISSVVLLSARV